MSFQKDWTSKYGMARKQQFEMAHWKNMILAFQVTMLIYNTSCAQLLTWKANQTARYLNQEDFLLLQQRAFSIYGGQDKYV